MGHVKDGAAIRLCVLWTLISTTQPGITSALGTGVCLIEILRHFRDRGLVRQEPPRSRGPGPTVACHQQPQPRPGPRPLTCGVPSECLGTRSYETTSRDQRGKIQMFFSLIGACTATKSSIANHRSSIVAQLYFASVTHMFLMPLFVKVESDSSKLLRTVSKSGPNGCKERSRPQKMLMRIKIESFLGRQNLVLMVTHSHKQPREEQKMIVT